MRQHVNYLTHHQRDFPTYNQTTARQYIQLLAEARSLAAVYPSDIRLVKRYISRRSYKSPSA
jgi:hypothetical protein